MLQTIKIGSFYNQSSYNTMFYVGCIFFILLLCWKKHRELYGISLWKALVMAVISIGFGYGTTSLMFGFENKLQNFTGFSWYGAVFFMPVSMAIIFWFLQYVLKLDTLDYIHNLAAPLALMNGFMKIGCTLYGCCYGPVQTEGHFHIYNALFNRYMFPIQPIEAAWNFFVCGYILWYERRPGKLRYTYPTYMIIYSVGRFFCEFFRQTTKVAGFLTGGMVYALIAIVAGIVWIIVQKAIDKRDADRISPHYAGVTGWRQHG